VRSAGRYPVDAPNVTGRHADMTNYWTSLFSRKTYKQWREAGCPPEAAFPIGARGRVARIAKGDFLLCYLSSPDSAFVAVQEVVGTMRETGSATWDEQYPLTVEVRNLVVLEPEEAVRYLTLDFLPTMAGRQAGRSVPSRGRVGQSAILFPQPEGKRVVDAVLKLARVSREIAAMPIEKPTPTAEFTPQPEALRPEAAPLSPSTAVAQDQAEATEHHATQALLVKLGRKLGRDVWVAKNDRAKLAAASDPAEASSILASLPRLSGNSRVQNTIELIDVLWLRNGDCEAAFEVECTTSVYSGLLRMSDLVTLQPNIATRMYIVAPEARRDKVRAEILRPTFSEALTRPLHRICRFLSIEKLKQLEAVPDIFWDSFMISVIDKVSETVE